MVMSFPAFASGAALGAGFTTTVTWSSDVAPPLSVTLSLNIYVPSTSPFIAVDEPDAFAIVAAGPETFVHKYDAIVPSPSVDPLPLSVTVFVGSVIVTSAPAFATGAALGAGFTTTVTWSSDVAPPVSVTLSLNTYVPSTSPFIAVDEPDAFAIV